MSYYPYPNNMHRDSSYGAGGNPYLPGLPHPPVPLGLPWEGCPSDGITRCKWPGPDPLVNLPPTVLTGPYAQLWIDRKIQWDQDIATYQQYMQARAQRLQAAKEAAAKQTRKLAAALEKECKAGNQDACLQLKKMGFKGLAGISPFAYGAMPPASDEEKGRNLQIFVGAMGLLLLGTLVFGAKGK